MEVVRSNDSGGPGASSLRSLVVIGANTGGPTALSQLIPKFPKNLPAAVLIVQQMRPGFTRLLAEHLDLISDLPVSEAGDGQVLKPGEAYLVPGGFAATVSRCETLTGRSFCVNLEDLSQTPEKSRSKNNNALRSAAEAFGPLTVGVVMTGLGDDGKDGLRAIREVGGRTIAQDEASSVLQDMPKAAIDAGVVDEVLPLYNMADRITELVGESNAEFLQEAAG